MRCKNPTEVENGSSGLRPTQKAQTAANEHETAPTSSHLVCRKDTNIGERNYELLAAESLKLQMNLGKVHDLYMHV